MKKDISDILREWPAEGDLVARCIVDRDGKKQLQLRIDLGLLQMELDGRPDGEKPFGRPSLLDHLQRLSRSTSQPDFDAETWGELDREIYQYYHRRRALLILGAFCQSEGQDGEAAEYYRRAVRDANHNLRVMDFIKTHCDSEDYVTSHEQYRPFVIMHRALAEAQAELLVKDPEEAIERLKDGIRAIEAGYEDPETLNPAEAYEQAEQDPSILQLRALERQVRKQHKVTLTLQEKLAEAVQNEQYERAAELRDRLRAKQEARSNQHSVSVN